MLGVTGYISKKNYQTDIWERVKEDGDRERENDRMRETETEGETARER